MLSWNLSTNKILLNHPKEAHCSDYIRDMGFFFLSHVFLTIFLTGLVWFVQLVHYPLYRYILQEDWVNFEKEHMRRTTWVTLYPMLLEAITGLITLYIWYSEYYSSLLVYGMLLNGVLALTTWASTFLIQVPLHQQLCKGFDLALINRLIFTNWLRVFLWTTRAILLLYLWTIL